MFALCIGFSDNMQLVSVAKLLGQNLYGTVDILPNNYTITTGRYIQGASKKTDTFDIQMNNKGVSFF
jgi:hypothetical protein